MRNNIEFKKLCNKIEIIEIYHQILPRSNQRKGVGANLAPTPNLFMWSPTMVKHVVKGKKWACSTLEEGRNKPVMFIAKTRDFKRFCEEIKENRRFG